MHIPKCQLLEFEGEINESTKEGLIKLFSETTPFEWEEEYLILHFDKNEAFESEVLNLQIQDVVKVYPLSAQAKSSIETKIDTRIKLEMPIFENILPRVEQTIEKHELEKAIQALWNICNITDDLNKYLSNIGLDNIFKGLERRKKGTKPSQIKDGNYWEYVLAYDRFDYFPNSTLGYFFDAGQIFANTKGLLSFEGSVLHKFLQGINSSKPEIKIKEIVKLLETSLEGEKYVSQTTVNEQLQYLITPLYLMLKDEIRKAKDIKTSNLFRHLNPLKEFGFSFNYAIILLGAFFGFKKFYDAYYDNLNLRFYKSYQPVKGKKEGVTKYSFGNQSELIKSNSFKEDTVSVDNKVSEDRSTDKEQPLEIVQTKSEVIPFTSETTSSEEKTKSKEQAIASNDNLEKSERLEDKDNNESAIKDKILPTNDIESIVSVKPIGHLKKLNSDTETVIRLKNIINELLVDKAEMKLTDMGDKVKEITGQKVTNTIIKNVIKSMDNIEIVPKKKPETARKTIMKDLFNNQL